MKPAVQSSSPFPTVSFAAIQLFWAAQDPPPNKEKQSLVEIQETEPAPQIEKDFLRRWSAKKERLLQGQGAAALLPVLRMFTKKGTGEGGAEGRGVVTSILSDR